MYDPYQPDDKPGERGTMTEASPFVLRTSDYAPRDLHAQLTQYPAESQVQLTVDNPLDGLGAGLEQEICSQHPG